MPSWARSLPSHYSALSQWTTFLSAFQYHRRFFKLQKTPQARTFALQILQAVTLSDQNCSFQRHKSEATEMLSWGDGDELQLRSLLGQCGERQGPL